MLIVNSERDQLPFELIALRVQAEYLEHLRKVQNGGRHDFTEGIQPSRVRSFNLA